MIHGIGPLGNDQATEEFGAILILISERIQRALNQLENLKSAESSVMGDIAALRVLVEAFPGPARIALRRNEIEDWRNRYFSWLDRTQSKIPDKFRDGIRETAASEFDRLLQKF